MTNIIVFVDLGRHKGSRRSRKMLHDHSGYCVSRAGLSLQKALDPGEPSRSCYPGAVEWTGLGGGRVMEL